ncbi:MAG: hypothetical protein HS122_06305 [Opitutaceae bacterium]|nr:hypothetical protein [Opitutaceae bacterium]
MVSEASRTPARIPVPFALRPHRSSNATHDLTTFQNYLTTTTTSAEPDAYGNVTSITVATSDGFSKTTTSQYKAPDTAAWILGRLSSVTVTSSAPGQQPVTRTSSFDYNASTGLLTSETVELAIRFSG